MDLKNKDIKAQLLGKQDYIMDTFNLDEKEFSLMLHYYENEPTLDGRENEPVKVLKDIDGDGSDDNTMVVSDRFCCGLEYARMGGFDLK